LWLLRVQKLERRERERERERKKKKTERDLGAATSLLRYEI
jgi:hypothetical protein